MKTVLGLLPFSENTHCEKCGGTLEFQFVAGDNDPVDCGRLLGHPLDHIRKTCSRCGYSWMELTKDYSSSTSLYDSASELEDPTSESET